MAAFTRLDWHDEGYRAGHKHHWIKQAEFPSGLKLPVRNQAREVLNRFWSEFQSILNDEEHPQHATSREFVAESNWAAIPSCDAFEMGLPYELQGCEPKLIAYYQTQVDRVRKGESTTVVAEDCIKPEWSVGRKGIVHRQEDLEWLIPILNDHYAVTKDMTDPEAIQLANKATLDRIENRWNTRDETPAEPSIAIDSFEMQTVPVIHRWFRMFYPEHEDAVRTYLADFDEERKPDIEVPTEDHAAAYISWYDAWAFCQWARWKTMDAETGTVHYRCRLPHEAEWEYAARANGPKHARYWWGNDFYTEFDRPNAVERLTTPRAHADGRRGKTRNPMVNVEANPFGLKDVLGNVWEWMANPYHEIYTLGPPDSKNRPAVNPLRTMRGGLWYVQEHLTKITNRFQLPCDDRDFKMGFRIIREPRKSLDEG
ncbi:MAG: SUMF1/EgtB/PvdO family nonheme iron enzyme [Planctomycetaceae bacterium]|nr:SUMF1/EgtB/PvdO family nonheme iron enzyme [Planctomycetaceae bacterium]